MNIFKATVRDVLSEGILSRNPRSSSRWHRIQHRKFQSVIIVKTSKKIVLKTTLCNVLSEGISSRNLRSSSRWHRIQHRKFQSVIIVKTSKKIVLKTTLCNVLSEGISSRNLRSSSRWRRCLRRVEENGDSASGYAKIHRSKSQNSPIKTILRARDSSTSSTSSSPSKAFPSLLSCRREG